MTFKRFAVYYLICLALTVLALWPTKLPQANWALRNGYVQALAQQANELAKTRAENERLKKALEAASQPAAGGS